MRATVLLKYGCALLYALICVAVGFVAGRLGMPKPYTRKLIHISVGLEWGILYICFGASFHTLAVCLLCLAFLTVAYRLGWFSSTMGSDGDNAPGTVYYAVAMSCMAAVCLLDTRFLLPFGIGVICTSLGDGVAGIVGQLLRRRNPRIYKNKSLFGSLGMFLACAVGTWGFAYGFSMSLPWYAPLAIAMLGTCVELLSERGLDNIAVPLSTAALAYGLLVAPTVVQGYLCPILLSPIVLLLVLRAHALTPMGTVWACVLDLAFSLSLGNAGFLLLLSFLVFGVLTDKIGRQRKLSVLPDEAGERRHGRSSVQVLSSAAFAAVFCVAYALGAPTPFLYASIASLAEALGDTAASGIGVLSRKTYDICRLRPIERGTSGGVSLLGFVAALGGCSVVCMLAAALYPLCAQTVLLLIAISFFGTLIDSILGSLVQGKFRCKVCGRPTEKRSHCGEKTTCVGGCARLTNESVNALASLFTGGIALVVFFLANSIV